MRIVYNRNHKFKGTSLGKHDAFVLLPDNWNDFGFRTLFDSYLWLGGNWLFVGKVRLYIDSEPTTRVILDQLPADKNTGCAKIAIGERYISLGASLDYYKRLVQLLGQQRSLSLLESLHDAPILATVRPKSKDLNLLTDPAYRTSLLRDLAAEQAQAHAPSVVLNVPRPGSNYHFKMEMKLDGFSVPHNIDFDFREALLPGNIVALIGANGLGKTQALLHLVDYLLRMQRYETARENGLTTLEPFPKFRKIIAMSLSPYSSFPSPSDVPEKNRNSYTRIGFHGENGRFSTSSLKARELPWLKQIIQNDLLETIDEWKIRFPRLNQIARAVGIDELVLRVPDADNYSNKPLVLNKHVLRYLKTGNCRLRFKRSGTFIRLSSGQQQLFHMTLALLAELEPDSLVLIDEPELYLHPNIEIEFIKLLNGLLRDFESRAIIATHSNTIVRELPSSCVQVFRAEDDVPFIRKPDFQTFGADVSAIANKVFDGVYVTHPFQSWLLARFGNLDFEDVLSKHGGHLNEESLSFLFAHSKRGGTK